MAVGRWTHNAIHIFSTRLYPQEINASELINVLYINQTNMVWFPFSLTQASFVSAACGL